MCPQTGSEVNRELHNMMNLVTQLFICNLQMVFNKMVGSVVSYISLLNSINEDVWVAYDLVGCL